MRTRTPVLASLFILIFNRATPTQPTPLFQTNAVRDKVPLPAPVDGLTSPEGRWKLRCTLETLTFEPAQRCARIQPCLSVEFQNDTRQNRSTRQIPGSPQIQGKRQYPGRPQNQGKRQYPGFPQNQGKRQYPGCPQIAKMNASPPRTRSSRRSSPSPPSLTAHSRE